MKKFLKGLGILVGIAAFAAGGKLVYDYLNEDHSEDVAEAIEDTADDVVEVTEEAVEEVTPVVDDTSVE